jgi:glycerol-3-phosphate dehydrogenase
MNRHDMLKHAFGHPAPWDLIVVGGGATGVGVAVDGATRGYDVLLLEQHDFGKGTSSRSTKLVHGGVRYLRQGNFALVREALRERSILRQNAPHLVHPLAFLVPCYSWWESLSFAVGLQVYHFLSRQDQFGPTRWLSKRETRRRLPTLNPDGLRGGVVYADGQFDDARLLINLVGTAVNHGATLLNYAPVVGLTKSPGGAVTGVRFRDAETGREGHAAGRVVVNATGAFCDGIRRLADPAAADLVAPSQGIHLVLDKSFLPGGDALLVPHTPDRRVMFALPWHNHTLLGTTDVAIAEPPLEPRATDAEINLLLEVAGRYLRPTPTRADIRSVFAGIRPLVRGGRAKNTAALSRDHTIHTDAGLVTMTGGKWTTYRNMAEDGVNQAARLAQLVRKPCITRTLKIHGYHTDAARFGPLAVYGSDAPAIQALARSDPALAMPLHPNLPYIVAEVVWAARFEMARTVEDVLARRTRALFLDARAARAMAPRVAELLAKELGHDARWQTEQVTAFELLARGYLAD